MAVAGVVLDGKLTKGLQSSGVILKLELGFADIVESRGRGSQSVGALELDERAGIVRFAVELDAAPEMPPRIRGILSLSARVGSTHRTKKEQRRGKAFCSHGTP
jgi:hypothetical protein